MSMGRMMASETRLVKRMGLRPHIMPILCRPHIMQGSIVENGMTLGEGADTGDGRTYRWTDASNTDHTYFFLNGDKNNGGDLLVDGLAEQQAKFF